MGEIVISDWSFDRCIEQRACVRACVPQVREAVVLKGWAGERSGLLGRRMRCGVWVGLVWSVDVYAHVVWCGIGTILETGGRSRTLLRRRTVFRRRAWAIWVFRSGLYDVTYSGMTWIHEVCLH